jgi:hypothetical protein
MRASAPVTSAFATSPLVHLFGRKSELRLLYAQFRRALRFKVHPAAELSQETMMSGLDGRLQARPAAAAGAPAGPSSTRVLANDHTDHLLKVQKLNLAHGDRYTVLLLTNV